jgi:hypothetical protein
LGYIIGGGIMEYSVAIDVRKVGRIEMYSEVKVISNKIKIG